MARRRLRTRCERCSYGLIRSKEIRPDTPFPRCSNSVCPVRPACPECGSAKLHQVLLTGTMMCRGCHTTFDPRDQLEAE